MLLLALKGHVTCGLLIMKSSLGEKACTGSITLAGPQSDPDEMLGEIIEAWWDLAVEEQGHSWKLTSVNQARTGSPNKDLLHSVYILTQRELSEFCTRSFVQVHIETFISDLVRIELQAAL